MEAIPLKLRDAKVHFLNYKSAKSYPRILCKHRKMVPILQLVRGVNAPKTPIQFKL